MFERYTERARRVLFFARFEASQRDAPAMESEHLLLGLLRENDALAKRLLEPHVAALCEEIVGRLPPVAAAPNPNDMPLSRECRQVLNFAAEESEGLGQQHIGTEHLLLGLLRLENGSVAEMLQQRGLKFSQVREEAARVATLPNAGGRTSTDDWDASQIRRYRDGDRGAFDLLWAKYETPLMQMATNLTGSAAAVPRLLEEIQEAAHRGLEEPRLGLAWRVWLYRIAANHCMEYIRNRP